MNENNPVIIKLHPQPEEYVENETAFLRAVGLCITQWAYVDRGLFGLFRLGIGAATHRAAIVYYEQHSLSQRLRHVDALLNGMFEQEPHKEYKQNWKVLHQRIIELLPTRNIIAHQPVQRMGIPKDGKAVYIYRIYIEPYQSLLKKRHKGMKGKEALTTEDLIGHSEEVVVIVNDLRNFAIDVTRAFIT